MFEQTFKNIDDILRKAGGSQTELDYVEQTSWILFLKYLDDLEKDKAVAAKLRGEEYTPIIAPEYQWSNWAMPLDANGKLDYNKALTGDDLNEFVNLKLFPYLKNFKTIAQSSDTIEYKIGEIFSELKNKIASGYGLREIIELIGKLRFRTHAEKHEMSHLYEAKIKNMGNAGRNGGEYYTPRPLITTIIKVVDPKIGQTIYDGAVGSAGFLVEAFEYLIKAPSTSSGQGTSTSSGNNLSSNDWETLQKYTFYGKEKGSLAYIIAIMNMILHGIEAPNIIHTNTLTENLADIQEKDRYDIVLANPPFGGKERAEVQQNFPIKTGETASLFLQHFIKILKAGGKAGIVIKNTFLSNGGAGSADARLRQQLLENNNLHTILDLPAGVFTAGVKTVVLFFTKCEPTQKVWYYQLNLNRNLGKTNPLNEQDLAEFVELQKLALSGAEGAADSENSWSINIADIDQNTFDLSVKNPNKKTETTLRDPQDILAEIQTLDKKSTEILKSIQEIFESYLQGVFEHKGDDWEEKKLGEVTDIVNGGTPKTNIKEYWDGDIHWITPADLGKLKTSIVGETSRKISSLGLQKSSAKLFPENSVILSTRAPIGHLAINKVVMSTNQGCRGIVPKKMLDTWYLYYFLKKNVQLLNELGTGTTFKELSKGALSNIVIPFPSIEEQQAIVHQLDALRAETQKLEAIYTQKLNDLEELQKSLLQKAFAGELVK